MSVTRRTVLALGILTYVTGLIDAASVLGLGHVFTANMTGNIVFLGFSLAGAGKASIAKSLLALGGFLAGALLGGRANRVAPRFRASMVIEAGLLGAAAIGATLVGEGRSQGLVIVLLAASMGLQNAVVRRLAVPDMTTTVLTLTMTGLAADSRLAGGDGPRTGRRLASVLLMLAGAFSGACLVPHGARWVLLGAAFLVALAWGTAE
jgi:uncharacterized membrane protein YoaK (UPF0700 family)